MIGLLVLVLASRVLAAAAK